MDYKINQLLLPKFGVDTELKSPNYHITTATITAINKQKMLGWRNGYAFILPESWFLVYN